MKRTQFTIVVGAVLIICFILGCATPKSPKSSGVFPSGKETYTVVITGIHHWQGTTNIGELMKQAYQEANSFCETKGKVMQPIATSSSGPFRPYGPLPYFELRFRALRPDDPDYRRPDLEPVPDVKINIKDQ